MYGKVSKTLALFRLYGDTGEEEWKIQVKSLLREIMEKCAAGLFLSYDGGLCGIGVVIEYLIQNNFVEGNANEILEDIDPAVITAIENRSLMDSNIEKGLLGLAYYFYERLNYRV